MSASALEQFADHWTDSKAQHVDRDADDSREPRHAELLNDARDRVCKSAGVEGERQGRDRERQHVRRLIISGTHELLRRTRLRSGLFMSATTRQQRHTN